MTTVGTIEQKLKDLKVKQQVEAVRVSDPRSLEEQIADVEAELKAAQARQKKQEKQAEEEAAQIQRDAQSAILSLVAGIQEVYNSIEKVKQLQAQYRQTRLGFSAEELSHNIDIEHYLTFSRKALERFTNNRLLMSLLESEGITIEYRRR